jgi:hypothetical protein
VKFGVNDYFSGVYLDEWTRRAEVRGNLLLDVAQGIYLHNSFDNRVADNLVLGARAQPLLELVDPPIRATLRMEAAAGLSTEPGRSSGVPSVRQASANDGVELPNRLQGALVSPPLDATWMRGSISGLAAALEVDPRPALLVVEGPPNAPVPPNLSQRCMRLFPNLEATLLPAQVLRCQGN